MTDIETLNFQIEHFKKIHDKEKVAELQRKKAELTPKKITTEKNDCSTCDHKKSKIYSNGFRDYEGIYCDKFDAEIFFNHDLFYRKSLYKGYLQMETAVLDCENHSSKIQLPGLKSIKLDPTKPFHSYPLLFTFARNYDKLDFDTFTTIRSVKFNKDCKDYPNFPKYTIGRYSVCGKVAPTLIVVMDWLDNEIQKFSLDVLKFDISPDICNSHADFVQKLNALYKEIYGFGSNSLTTIKRLFFIQKIKFNEIGEYQQIEVKA